MTLQNLSWIVRGPRGLETRPQTMRSFKSQLQPPGSRLHPPLRIWPLRVEPEACPLSGRSPQRAVESCQSRKNFFILDYGWFLKDLGFHTLANRVDGVPPLHHTTSLKPAVLLTVPNANPLVSWAFSHLQLCFPFTPLPRSCPQAYLSPRERAAWWRHSTYQIPWHMEDVQKLLTEDANFYEQTNKPCPRFCDANATLPLQPV